MKTKKEIEIKDILMLLFGVALLIFTFTMNSFDTMDSCVSSSGDQWIVVGSFSGLFVLTYGIGIGLLCFGLKNLRFV